MRDLFPLLQGTLTTLQLAGCALLLGLLGGMLFATLESAKCRSIRLIASTLVMLIRGVPEILVVLLVYFMAPSLLVLLSNGFSIPLYITTLHIQFHISNFDVSPFGCGVSALALLYAAYASQTLRGALQAIPKGQTESGQALGLSRWSIFYRIIVPQMWRHAIPGLGNQWLVLLKDTALVSLIAVNDIMMTTKGFITRPQDAIGPFYGYLIAGAIYLAITLCSRFILKQIALRSVHFERES